MEVKRETAEKDDHRGTEDLPAGRQARRATEEDLWYGKSKRINTRCTKGHKMHKMQVSGDRC